MTRIKRGTGRNVGSSFAQVLADAARLESVNGMEPWVIIMQFSPRRWSYGIRFYRAGQPAPRVQYFTGNGRPSSEPEEGGNAIYPVCRPGDADCARRRR